MKRIFSQIILSIQNRRRFGPFSPSKQLKHLLKTQYWSTAEIEGHQLSEFNKLVQLAKQKTSFYKIRFANISLPLNNLKEAIIAFPKLRKADIKKDFKELCNMDGVISFKSQTSGSTGIPLIIQISRKSSSDRFARLMRFLNWWGVEIYDRNILIWGSNSLIRTRKDRIKDWLRNRKSIDPLSLNKESVLEIYRDLIEFKPVWIRGYTSAILQLAKLLDENNLSVRSPHLKVIIVTAEMLFKEDRIYIESVFNCKVANEYGAAEVGIIANECPMGGMHLNEESLYLECNSDNNVIISDLSNEAMPIINYINEDRIKLSQKSCECGRQSRVVESIEGRYSDLISCPDGTEKGQVLFYYLMKELEDKGFENSVLQYKFYQSGLNFTIEIVEGKVFSDAAQEFITSRMKELIGPSITTTFKIVQDIKRETSGKLRFFVNLDS